MTRFLAACRFLLIVPVIGCIILTGGAVTMGIGRIAAQGIDVWRAGDFSPKAAKTVALATIEIIELFLVGTVAYITAVGIYKLFIAEGDIQLPFKLKIETLKDLKEKIIGLVVAALAFFLYQECLGPPASDS